MTRATGAFDITIGGQDIYEERDGGGSLAHSWGEQAFSGDISGDGSVHWLISYASDKTARLIGLQRIKGSVGGRTGSLVIEATADHNGASSHGSWTIVDGSGTGQLAGITGSGSFDAPGGKQGTYELDFEVTSAG
jgi:hypothetical protein